MSDYLKGGKDNYTLTSEWKESAGGQTAIGESMRDKKKVFIKKYTTMKMPVFGPDITEADYKKRCKTFERLVQVRKDINSKLRTVSAAGGNILVPSDDFVFENLFYEVSEFVEGTISDPDEVAKLPYDDRILLLKTAAAALKTVHERCNIIHCDVKSGNLMVARTRDGYLVGKLIDFDCSLFADKPLPRETGGDQNYMSPELMLYSMSEGDPEYAKKVTYKTDIFSLGLVFHFYLAGKLPEYDGITEPRLLKKLEKGVRVYPCQVVQSGGTIVISDEIEPKFASLIRQMIDIDPAKRPDCGKLLETLKEGGTGAVPEVICPPAPEHSFTWNVTKLRADGFTGTRMVSPASKQEYEMLVRGKVKNTLTVDQLVKKGYAIKKEDKAKRSGSGFDEPWPEDDIKWDETRIKQKFYSGVKRASPGKYVLTRLGGSSREYTADELIKLKYATGHAGKGGGGSSSTAAFVPKTDTTGGSAGTDAGEPWPEDHIAFDMGKITAARYVSIRRVMQGSEKKYELQGAGGRTVVLAADKLVKLGYARKV